MSSLVKQKAARGLILQRTHAKATRRQHLTPVRRRPQKANKEQVRVRMRRKGNPGALLVGVATGVATVQTSTEAPWKTKSRTTTQPLQALQASELTGEEAGCCCGWSH